LHDAEVDDRRRVFRIPRYSLARVPLGTIDVSELDVARAELEGALVQAGKRRFVRYTPDN